MEIGKREREMCWRHTQPPSQDILPICFIFCALINEQALNKTVFVSVLESPFGTTWVAHGSFATDTIGLLPRSLRHLGGAAWVCVCVCVCVHPLLHFK